MAGIVLGGQTVVSTRQGDFPVRELVNQTVELFDGTAWVKCAIESHNDDAATFRFRTYQGYWFDATPEFAVLFEEGDMHVGQELINQYQARAFEPLPLSDSYPSPEAVQEDLTDQTFPDLTIAAIKELVTKSADDIYRYICYHIFDTGYIFKSTAGVLDSYLLFDRLETATYFKLLCHRINIRAMMLPFSRRKTRYYKNFTKDVLNKVVGYERTPWCVSIRLDPGWLFNATGSPYHHLLNTAAIFDLMSYAKAKEYRQVRDITHETIQEAIHKNQICAIKDDIVAYEPVYYTVDKYKVTPLEDARVFLIGSVPVYVPWG